MIVRTANIRCDKNPVKTSLYFGIGAALPLMLYFSIYLLPLSAIGLIATFALGMGLHIFVPLLLSIGIIRIIYLTYADERTYFKAAIAGVVLPIVFVVVFAISWNISGHQINQTHQQASSIELDIPQWVYMAQHINNNLFNDLFLKQDILYPSHPNWGSWDRLNNSFAENQKHNPLVVIAQIFSPKLNLSKQDRLKILTQNPKSRHQAKDKLWRGDYLITDKIETKVEIMPQYRMAYTEKNLWIKNTSPKGWRGRNQEALYTFQLPEGGIITSLSLWVNGKEEKAYSPQNQKPRGPTLP